MANCIVIKQDINFLDKPLWFQNVRHDGIGFVWTDIEGYEYRTGYKLPDKTDILILYYLLHKAQDMGFQKNISVTKYEVLKECGLLRGSRKFYYQRLDDSLLRWKNVTLKFHGTFYDGKSYQSMTFGILNETKLEENQNKIYIELNETWLQRIQYSEFFKLINFEYYKALKRPLSRRLYEVLCKTFKGRDEWHIALTKLGLKLTTYSRTREEGKEPVVYASDVLVAIKPAINEINRLATIPDIIEKTGIFPEDLFTVEYKITGAKQGRKIYFTKVPIAIVSKKPKKLAKPEVIEYDLPPQDEPAIRKSLPTNVPETANVVTAEIQIAFAEAIGWLGTIPDFAEARRKDIGAMPMTLVAKQYASIRKEYEKMKKQGRTPTAGWIYSAFTEQYKFPQDIKREQKEESRRQEKHEQDVKEKALAFIEANGGLKKVCYCGYAILRMLGESGFEIRDQKGVARGLLWHQASLEFFEAV